LFHYCCLYSFELSDMLTSRRVAAARPKALPMENGQTIGKLVLAAATQNWTARRKGRLYCTVFISPSFY
jgi:hypothetical protein